MFNASNMYLDKENHFYKNKHYIFFKVTETNCDINCKSHLKKKNLTNEIFTSLNVKTDVFCFSFYNSVSLAFRNLRTYVKIY